MLISASEKFSFQAHMVRKPGAENRCQKMEPIYGAGFWNVCRGYKLAITSLLSNSGQQITSTRYRP